VLVYFIDCLWFFSALILIFSVLAERLAGKSIFDMTHLVSSETLNLNSVNQSSMVITATD